MKVRYILQGTTEVIEEREATELPEIGPIRLVAGQFRVIDIFSTPSEANSFDAILIKGKRSYATPLVI